MRCSIKLKAFNYLTLEEISQLCIKEAKADENVTKISFSRLPKKIKKFSLIRSPHVHKKSREQFESITYKRLINLEGPQATLDKIITKSILKNKKSFYFKVTWQA